jgi:hypothetical protein
MGAKEKNIEQTNKGKKYRTEVQGTEEQSKLGRIPNKEQGMMNRRRVNSKL